MKIEINNIEQMSEQLHVWYLEGTRKLDPANYNPKAQKAYADLNDQQKEIDRYIAKKIISVLDALKFYADKENWVDDVQVEGSNQINQDGGIIARDALTLNLWKQT